MTSQTLMLARSPEMVTELWLRAVTEGERQAGIILGPLLEEHLAMTPRSYIADNDLCRVVAREFLPLWLSRDTESLIKLAGRCLIIAGLFPALARRRNVKMGYFFQV